MLWSDVEGDFPQIINAYYPEVTDNANIFKKIGVVRRAIRRVLIKSVHLQCLYVDSWINSINQYDMIVVPADKLTLKIPEYLNKKGYRGRLIWWYWNPVNVEASPSPNLINRQLCELWSFDKRDCEIYQMRYNTQYFFARYPRKNTPITQDFYFVGKEKGRYSVLKELEKKLASFGYSTKFIITANSPRENSHKYDFPISYKDNLQRDQESRCIVEINQENQVGLTLRSLEALFFEKKLITDNTSIMEEEFYDENNILLLEEVSKDSVHEFINKPFQAKNSAVQFYDFNSWIERFCADNI